MIRRVGRTLLIFPNEGQFAQDCKISTTCPITPNTLESIMPWYKSLQYTIICKLTGFLTSHVILITIINQYNLRLLSPSSSHQLILKTIKETTHSSDDHVASCILNQFI